MEQQQSNQDNTIQEALHTYKEGLHSFTQKLPHIAKSYNKFTETCFEEGTLTKKGKQLIALGISVYSQDEYCIIYHTKGCLDQGCSEDEILESVGVAAAFGGGAAMSQGVTLVQEAIQKLGNNSSKQAFQ